jgi:hypothetical protein
MAEGAYKGPRRNRRMLNKNTVFVSKEELADFKKRFGADKTLRDLLNTDKTGKLPEAVGAYRGRRAEGANVAPKKEEDSGIMQRLRRAGLTAKGAEEAGGLSSSAMAALGIAGGAAGRAARGTKAASASGGSVAPALRAEFEAFKRGGVKAMEQERRGAAMAKRAEGPATPLKSTNVTSETGRRFTAAQEREAAEAAVRGAAARKEMAAKRAGRSRAMEEAKTQRMMRDEKKKPSPRSRTRDKEDIEFSYGGMAKKKRK